MLTTKSLEVKRSKKDGIRICVMRRIRPEYDFDLWYPKVAPSERLLRKYVIKKEIGWQEFKPKFLRFLKRNSRYIKFLVKLAQEQNVTLLCWEKSPKQCHRRLVAEECKKINPKLKVVIK